GDAYASIEIIVDVSGDVAAPVRLLDASPAHVVDMPPPYADQIPRFGPIAVGVVAVLFPLFCAIGIGVHIAARGVLPDLVDSATRLADPVAALVVGVNGFDAPRVDG